MSGTGMDAWWAAINQALAILPPSMDSREARVMLMAIGLQESGLKHRRQMGDGPARGFAQFERTGGVRGVMTHPATKAHAKALCRRLGRWFIELTVWRALERDDILAAGFARLLLWSDPRPLPPLGAEQHAWTYYLRNWRPGRPHPDAWPANYAAALRYVMEKEA